MHESNTIEIDGSLGEGGGQVLRTALALSLITQRPLMITGIRARRKKPGLMRQHLAGVELAAKVGAADVRGAALGSQQIEFRPQALRGGRFLASIGSAGSTTLLAQTVVPALWFADQPSELILGGGTHNPLAPTAGFLDRCYARAIARMGLSLDVEIRRHGFFPAGGGELRVGTAPARPRPIEWRSRGELRNISARAIVAELADHIATRELEVVGKKLGLGSAQRIAERVTNGPGNALEIVMDCDDATEVVTAIGQRAIPAERVAQDAVRDAKAYLRHRAPVGEHLADQLLIPLALAGEGSFLCGPPSMHATTNARVLEAFLPVTIRFAEAGDGMWSATVAPR
jgi:RNA 3'-terminal phosphate cyclase (ATP)